MNGNEKVTEVLEAPSSPIGEPPASEPPETVKLESTEQCETKTASMELPVPSAVTAVEREAVKDETIKDYKDDSLVHPEDGAESGRINMEVDDELVKGVSTTQSEHREKGETLVAPKIEIEVVESEVLASETHDEKPEPIAEGLELRSEIRTQEVVEQAGEAETVEVEKVTSMTDGYEGELRSQVETLATEGNDAEGSRAKAEGVPPIIEKSGKLDEAEGVESEVKSEELNRENEVPHVRSLSPVSDKADSSKEGLENQVEVKQESGVELQEENDEPSTHLAGKDEEMVEAESPELDASDRNGDDSLQVETDNQLIEDEETPTEGTPTADTEMEMEEETESEVVKSDSVGMQKPARNSKSPAKAPAKAPSRKTVGEDVCFICLDGGELVLCDKRACPKAYHPSCVDRDEAFFRSKGRWNCGWHICSKCQKNSYYMCYTCAFSLCKGCVRDADFVCIRGNKGLCETCMKNIMLIEKDDQENADMAVFNDQTSWEYLFKDYWMELKAKLSLTSNEVALARNPWKPEVKNETLAAVNDAENGGSGSDTSLGKHAKRKTKRRLKSQSKDVDPDSDDSSGNHGRSSIRRKKTKKLSKSHVKEGGVAETGERDSSQWASKELLDFVMYMRNGDKSIVSQYEVQELLLEYIKTKKLRDPRRRSQIVCDQMLERLFGKQRVGHFEMLKLLESHFLVKEDVEADNNQGSAVDKEDADGNMDVDGGKSRGKKLRRRNSDKGLQSNLDDYAAIDMHNISLIYLRRSLIEALMEDGERFYDKVVGCFVRIRISGSNQKQDMYRLVQVIGISKAAGPYKVGKRTTDDVLEILNLDKTEVVAIDTISNQEFTEDECKRLRQSIKCGLLSRLTVGDMLDKAKELLEVRVSDWLETETLRISHLCDRASDLGRKKELRECVEKLQLLKTPEERQRRLDEIPQVHADPNMDPNHDSDNESEADRKNQESSRRPPERGFSRRGRDQFSSRKGGSDLNDSWSGSAKPLQRKWELSRNSSDKGFSSRRDDTVSTGGTSKVESWNQGVDTNTSYLSSGEKSRIPSNIMAAKQAEYTGTKNHMSPAAAVEHSQLPSNTVPETEIVINETDKIWHYRDPTGKVQGPFSMAQLRKWNNTGYFPTDLQIWSTKENEDQSIVLTAALAGKFQKGPSVLGASLSDNHGLQTLHVFPSSAGISQNISSRLGAFGQGTDSSRMNQNPGGGNARSSVVSSSRSTPTMGRSLSDISARGNPSDYGTSSLPSPTPNRSNRGLNANQSSESRWSTSVPYGRDRDAVASPTAVATAVRQHTNASNIASREPMRVQQSSRESAALPSAGTGPGYSGMQGSGVAINNADKSFNSAPASAQQMPSQTIGGVQSVAGQNLTSYNQGWVPSYPNAIPAQQQNYGQWSNGSGSYSSVQTAASGNLSAANYQGFSSANPWGHQVASTPQNIAWAMAASVNAAAAPTPQMNMGWVGSTQGVPPAGVAYGQSQGQAVGRAGGQPAVPVTGAQGAAQGNKNMIWPNTVQVSPMGSTNQGWVAQAGNLGTWGNEQNQDGDGSWNRQSSYGGAGANPPDTPTMKGQRVCKFHENGHCKKGASCDYMHA